MISSDRAALTRSRGLAVANRVLWAAQGLWCLSAGLCPQHVAALEAQEPICLLWDSQPVQEMGAVL